MSVTERPRRKGMVYSDTIVPQIPAMNAAAGSTSRIDAPARAQNESPCRMVLNTFAWNGTIHARPAITQSKSCDRMKAHCWVCAALVTSCMSRALTRDRTAFVSRRAHCYKRDRTSQEKIGDGGHACLASCAKWPDEGIIWRAG